MGSIGIMAFRISRHEIKFNLKIGKFKQFRKVFIDEDDSKNIEKLFQNGEIKLNYLQYQLIRYVIFLILFLVNIIIVVKDWQGDTSYIRFIVLAAALFISNPKIGENGKKSWFEQGIDIVGNRVKLKRNIEIYSSISQFIKIILQMQFLY
jgi:hypothetical protein